MKKYLKSKHKTSNRWHSWKMSKIYAVKRTAMKVFARMYTMNWPIATDKLSLIPKHKKVITDTEMLEIEHMIHDSNI